MYEKLETYGKGDNIKTSNKKYPCSNYISPETQNFANYYNLPSSQNTNINQLPFYKVDENLKIEKPPIQLPKYSDMDNDVNEMFIPIFKNEEYKDKKVNEISNKSNKLVEEYNNNNKSYNDITPIEIDNKLLPVLDYKFNMREICKQCILLEDHLAHTEKRCPDCCIKHFLALEALSEEAIQLDKKNEGEQTMQTLPERIRKIQKNWYKNPSKNAIKCGQDLREIRKELMETSFPIIFDEEKNKKLSCNSSFCSLK